MTAVTKYGPNNSSHRFVLLMIADNAADDGSNAFPAVETLAEKTALSERTVIRAINALVKDGYLVRRRRKDTSNIYQIVLEKLEPPVSDILSPTVSDTVSPTQVTPCHTGNCHPVTYPGDTMSPDPSINHPSNRQEDPGRERAPIPAGLQSWFDEHKIPPPRTTEEITLIRSPAGQLWLNVTMRWPGWPSLRRIVQSIGSAPDEAALRKTWGDWELNGYSPRNIAGILEKYHAEAGRAGSVRNNPTAPNGRHSAEGVEQAKARFAAAMEEK